jgi:hypothetical protein
MVPSTPLRKVDEDGARQATLHRRPVLTTFRLSHSGWDAFSQHFSTDASRSSVLTRSHMAPHRSLPDDGGHAVVLYGCAPRSLKFLNSWGNQWGKNGSFSVEDHTVLELDGASQVNRVCFYDVYWLEKDFTAAERQAYDLKVDEALRYRVPAPHSIRVSLSSRCAVISAKAIRPSPTSMAVSARQCARAVASHLRLSQATWCRHCTLVQASAMPHEKGEAYQSHANLTSILRYIHIGLAR